MGVVIEAGLDDDAQAARGSGVRIHVRISESLVNPLERKLPCFRLKISLHEGRKIEHRISISPAFRIYAPAGW